MILYLIFGLMVIIPGIILLVYSRKRRLIPTVPAGTFDNKPEVNKNVSISRTININLGKYHPKTPYLGMVDGQCLEPIGIRNGMLFYANLYSNNSEKLDDLKIGDVILIKFKHEGTWIIKLREVYAIRGNDVEIQRYVNGKVKKERSLHNLSDVFGKLLYINQDSNDIWTRYRNHSVLDSLSIAV